MTLAGIDLGTSTLIVTASDPTGNPVVLTNDLGEQFTPSVVAFPPSGEILIGTEAKHFGIVHPDRCVRHWKRHLGTDEVLYREENGAEYRAQDVARILLEYAARLFQERTGEILSVASVTVPANFLDPQKKEILAAGRDAGVEVCVTPHEPTAAAFGNRVLDRADGQILVLDLGGGTFDVSLCNSRGNTVEVDTTNGVPKLGGIDFNERLLLSVLDEFEKQHGTRPSVVEHPVEFQELHARVEQAKVSLSQREEATILFSVDGKVLTHTVTRDTFRALTDDLLAEAMQCAQQTLTEAGVRVEDLLEILPVGGASKMRIFLDAIESTLGRPASSHADPFFAVGLGAFTLGRIHRESQGHQSTFQGGGLPEINAYVREKTPHAVGVAVVDDEGQHRNSVVLRKGQLLPSHHTQPYRLAKPGQTGCVIQVLQGRDGAPSEDCTELGRFELEGLTPVYDQPHKIEIRFHIDHNGILTAEALDQVSGVRRDLQVNYDMGRNAA